MSSVLELLGKLLGEMNRNSDFSIVFFCVFLYFMTCNFLLYIYRPNKYVYVYVFMFMYLVAEYFTEQNAYEN